MSYRVFYLIVRLSKILSLMSLGLSKFLFPGFFILLHCSLISSQLLLYFSYSFLCLFIKNNTTSKTLFSTEFFLEMIIFFMQHSNHFFGRVFIYYSLILYFFSSVRISQRAQGFFIIDKSWWNGTNHDSFWVSTQGSLKHMSQFAISIRYDYALSTS